VCHGRRCCQSNKTFRLQHRSVDDHDPWTPPRPLVISHMYSTLLMSSSFKRPAVLVALRCMLPAHDLCQQLSIHCSDTETCVSAQLLTLTFTSIVASESSRLLWSSRPLCLRVFKVYRSGRTVSPYVSLVRNNVWF
jgi:hypothetical protein